MRTRRAVLAASLPAQSTLDAVIGDATPAWERGMNEQQRAVILWDDGPCAAFAGAGSGKTRAVTHRVVRLVAQGVPGDRIFCTTFSRAGANEMDARIRQLGARDVSVQTWHAFCQRVLREEGTPQGQWTVDDKDKAKTFVKQAMGYKGENWVGGDLTKVRRFIANCKANLFDAMSPEAFELARRTFGGNARRAINVFEKSQTLIEEAGLLTFDDMLVFVARYFAENDDARRSWGAKFDQVIIDEGQDNNMAQKVIGEQLTRESGNLMIVGDPGQAIYGFRGSKPDYLMAFPEERGAKVITMNRNYRSGRKIVELANTIIRPAEARLPEDMVAERDFDGVVETMANDTLEDEAEELVEAMRARMDSRRPLSDVCVLYRLNAQSRSIEDALLAAKIPYVIVGGTNFYERKEVKDLLAYLRLAANRDKDGDSVRRCINAPFRYLGAKFVEKVGEAHAEDPEATWVDCVERAANQERIQDRQRRSAFEWVRLVEALQKMVVEGVPRDTALVEGEQPKMRPATAFDVLSKVVRDTNYVQWLEKKEGEESVESSHAANVREMVRVSQSFDSVPSMLDFVEKQVAESAKNKRGRHTNCVTMMSIHRSKGLEWPTVWVIGCNEGILPHARGEDDEERRLMYVAVTRARDHLVLSHVREMATRTGVRTMDRSRYLVEAFPESSPEAIDAVIEQVVERRALAPAVILPIEVRATVVGRVTNGELAAEVSRVRALLAAGDAIPGGVPDALAELPPVDPADAHFRAIEAAKEDRNPGSGDEETLIARRSRVFGGDCYECKRPIAECTC